MPFLNIWLTSPSPRVLDRIHHSLSLLSLQSAPCIPHYYKMDTLHTVAKSELESESCSFGSDSLWPHGLYSPWNSPGQNTGVGSFSLLHGIFPIQGSNPGLPCCRQILYQLSHREISKSTEVCSLSLHQWLFRTQETKWGLFHCRWILYQLSYQRSKKMKKKKSELECCPKFLPSFLSHWQTINPSPTHFFHSVSCLALFLWHP